MVEQRGLGAAFGGEVTTLGEQRDITTRDGQAFRMREWCNPFRTYEAFGEERWKARVAEIMATSNVAWPPSQAQP